MPMTESEVLAAIEDGESAYGLLVDADPKLDKRFGRLCKAMVDYLADVKVHFPDATYYTGSGGFNLLLGQPHDESGNAQQQLVAARGKHAVAIGDGDW